MEFIVGVVCGAILGWGVPRIINNAHIFHSERFYYVCPYDECSFTIDSNIENLTNAIAKEHEKSSHAVS